MSPVSEILRASPCPSTISRFTPPSFSTLVLHLLIATSTLHLQRGRTPQRAALVFLTRPTTTPVHEQACISRSARGAVWGVLTCLFVLSRYKGPKIFFACGAPRIPLEISKETVFSLQCFSLGPGAVLGGAYMLVRHHACSCKGVLPQGVPRPFSTRPFSGGSSCTRHLVEPEAVVPRLPRPVHSKMVAPGPGQVLDTAGRELVA